MKKVKAIVLLSAVVLGGSILSACAQSGSVRADGSNACYDDMNYIEVDGVTFRIGDNYQNIKQSHPQLEGDGDSVLAPKGEEDSYDWFFIEDKNEDSYVMALADNQGDEVINSYDAYISAYNFDPEFSEVEREIKLPSLITEIIEEFYTRQEEDPDRNIAMKELEKYEDKLVFVPFITDISPSGSYDTQVRARIIIFKDKHMDLGTQFDILLVDKSIRELDIAEDIYSLPESSQTN